MLSDSRKGTSPGSDRNAAPPSHRRVQRVNISNMNGSNLFPLVMLFAITSTAFPKEPATRPVNDPLEALESRTLYYPSLYEAGEVDAFLQDGGIRLDYKTPQGSETAFLIPPASAQKADHLWVIASGNAMLALNMASFCRETGFKSDAFVLVDYPGYGLCEGKPNPASIRENMKGAVLVACEQTGIDVKKNPERVSVFGHSLGCAAALLAVEEFHLRSAVLCSPYTSSHEMAERRIGLAKDAPFAHQIDNRLGLKQLQSDHGHAWIIHGEEDEIIPVQMSKTMAAEFPDVVHLQLIKHAHHNDILNAAAKEILQAMADARK
jgi:pimeloyl-ACP methyl ester carboxylesterase